jgi:hypothetical protein
LTRRVVDAPFLFGGAHNRLFFLLLINSYLFFFQYFLDTGEITLMKRVAALSILATAAAAHAAPANDIAGLQLGSSYANARPMMLKANPGYKFTDIILKGGKVAGTDARYSKGGKVVDQFVVLQDAAGAVWFMGRGQAFEQGSRIKRDTMLRSLEEKYGKPNDNMFGDGSQLWEFDRKGKQVVSKFGGQGAICNGGATSHYLGDMADPDKMVAAFSVMVMDSQRMYDELNGVKNKAENERLQKLKNEAAKDLKPKL